LVGAFFPGKEGFNIGEAGANLALPLEIFRACSANIETLFENLFWCHHSGTGHEVSDRPKDRFCQV
jgi:hypothetical protein